MIGSHCLKAYSVTQKFVTLSSGEAELMALVKATAEAIGLCQLAEGWKDSLEADVYVDSSAAIAVTARKGNGRLRHVRIGHMWVQELAEKEEVRFCKVRGETNPADLCTKHLISAKILELTPLISQYSKQGEADSRLRLGIIGSPGRVGRDLPTRAKGSMEIPRSTPSMRLCHVQTLEDEFSTASGAGYKYRRPLQSGIQVLFSDTNLPPEMQHVCTPAEGECL